MKEYDHARVEKKWQAVWEKKRPNRALDASAKKKFYALVEFPYPSGDGLHVGHIRPYTALDVIARKRRAEGYNVLFPIGWDAFGLPTENYAIKTGIQPAVVTRRNAGTFRRQLKSLGFSFDWLREINTTDSDYYKWTQWIFLKFLERGLAYKKKMAVNWCPKDKIGLANEEVVDGRCERCGAPVEKREKEQWMLAITKYADRLDRDLGEVDFLEKIKLQQHNWIGKSEGAEIDFYLAGALPKKILIGTRNRAKVAMVRDVFPKLPGVELVSLADLPPVDDAMLVEGDDFRENARRKAEFYFKKTGLPTIATDHIIWLEKWPKDGGFIIHCRKLANPGSPRATDGEVAAWIEKFVQKHGPSPARFHYAIAYADQNGTREYVSVQDEYVLQKERSQKPPHDGYVFDRYMKNPATGILRADEPAEIGFGPFRLASAAFCGEIFPSVKVFTTRPDTIFGATYLVLAPEHPLVEKVKDRLANRAEAARYISGARNKTDIERTAAEKEKTGVELGGVAAVNPATGENIPIWIADYVLAEYGTGAIMAVPAHDERDFAFAKKHGLPIKYAIAPVFTLKEGKAAWRPGEKEVRRPAVTCLVKHWSENKYLFLDKKEASDGGANITVAVSGGTDGESLEIAGKREIEEETGYKNARFIKSLGSPIIFRYYSSNARETRRTILYPLYFELENGEQSGVSPREKELHEPVWLSEREAAELQGKFVSSRPFNLTFWKRLKEGESAYAGEGILIGSGRFDGMDSETAKKAVTEFVGGKMVTAFKLRDWIFSRQRYWGEPIPVIHCKRCGVVPVPEKDLPVKLPPVKNYKPTETGESPLAAISKWVNVKCPKCKGSATRETDTMPNWAGSSWYYLRYLDPENKKAFAGRKKLAYWCGLGRKDLKAGNSARKAPAAGPVDWYNGGMEHTTLHLLYSRFWHKFLFDLGLVPTSEPYRKRTSHGLILAGDGEKMSKSRGNVVNPDAIVKAFGADTLRLYELFMGPFDQPVAWSQESLIGPRRFLERVWKRAGAIDVRRPGSRSGPSPEGVSDSAGTAAAILGRAVKKVSEDIEAMRFNTAVSQLMITLNDLEKLPAVPPAAFRAFLRLLAPFAPHITEELWPAAGGRGSVHGAPWPAAGEGGAASGNYTVVVQVDGRVRGEFSAAGELSESAAAERAQALPGVAKWLLGKTVRKVVYVKGRLLNFVLS